MKKQTNLLHIMQTMLLTAVLLSGSAVAEAKKENMKGLYVAGGGEYEDSKAAGKVRYLNGNFEYYPVVGCPNCYYIPDLRAVYITSCTINGVLLETTKNYPIPKLQLIIDGNVTVNTGGDKSCVRMYYKSLEITKPDNVSSAKLVLKQTGDKKGMFITRGGLTVKDITLEIQTRSKHTSISQEGSGHITFNNCNVTTNGPIYAMGNVENIDCRFTAGDDVSADVRSHYVYVNGVKQNFVKVVAAKGVNSGWKSSSGSSGSSASSSASSSSASSSSSNPAAVQIRGSVRNPYLRYHKSYEMGYTEELKVSGRVTRYKLLTSSSRGAAYLFKDTGGSMVLLLQNADLAGLDFDIIGNDFKILVEGNCSLLYIRADRFQQTDRLYIGCGKLDETSPNGYRILDILDANEKREGASATLTLTGDMASPINLNANFMGNLATLTVKGVNIIARHTYGMKYESVIRGCKEVTLHYCTIDGSYQTPFTHNTRLTMTQCGIRTPMPGNLYYSRSDSKFMNADCLKIVRENDYYDFSLDRSFNKIPIK